ncbi:zinc finger homeobox protein 2-like [Protopterus annectens]|uniref:zinc finger homeobox protein 2-like n=1 Tax=Protopterus annectens TaxID=7888 RepID=UPI001CFA59CE|nr:zinc finger homeobox protein 2-like [Protopterus annectens]
MDTLNTSLVPGRDDRIGALWSKNPSILLCESIAKDSPNLSTNTTNPKNMRPSSEDRNVHCSPETASAVSPAMEYKYELGLATYSALKPESSCQSLFTLEKNLRKFQDKDVEILKSDIVFGSDGSAYLIDSVNKPDLTLLPELCGHLLPKGFSQDSLPSGQCEVGGSDSNSSSTSTPSLITTFHIVTTYQGFNSDQMLQNTSARTGLIPDLHSFRIVNVRHKTKVNYLQDNSSAKNSYESKDVSANNVEVGHFSSCDGKTLAKPILLCLICKLSFGQTVSFMAHATDDHKVVLIEEEENILGMKNVSAIIQSFGKEKGPRISFLEPKSNTPISSDSTEDHSDPSLDLSDVAKGMFQGLVNVISTDTTNDMPLVTPKGIYNGDPDKVPSFVPNLFLGASTNELQLGILNNCGFQSSFAPMEDQEGRSKFLQPKNSQPVSSVQNPDVLISSVLESSDDSACWSPKGSQPTEAKERKPDMEMGLPSEYGVKHLQEKTEGDQDKFGVALGIPSAQGSHDSTEQLHSNQSVFERQVLSSQANSCPKDISAVVSTMKDGYEGENQSIGSPSVETDQMNGRISPASDFTKNFPLPSANSNGKNSILGEQLSFNTSTNDEIAQTPNAESSGADTFQSISLSNHMSLLHSRNSCKTLKCPKCNWHYKYQQTLQTHLKEKHPETGNHCIYCNTGQSHPRLARGESYTCGYKPYRCEVCKYSTTTKGNLSIHMQSDKHLANLQGLQSCSIASSANGVAQGLVPPPPPPPPPPSSSSSSSPSDTTANLSPTDKPKQKASWQCKVCNYETNISRNLRIHMTSEKHMQNMMLLHQGLPLGLPGLMQTPPDIYQYYGTQGMNLQVMKLENQADPRLMMNGFHLESTNVQSMPLNSGCGNPPSDARVASVQQVKPLPRGTSDDDAPLSPEEPSPLRVFSCLICRAFMTDSLEMLMYHASVVRSLPEKDWKEITGDVHRCRLCSYGTQLKANFQLHLKTDKHSQKYQLAAHLKEGGPSAERQLSHLNPANPIHLRCNVCEFESNSKEKMRLHASSGTHESRHKVYKHLQELDDLSESETPQYQCCLCDYTSSSKLSMVQHLHSVAHQNSQSQSARLQHLYDGTVDLGKIVTLQEFMEVDSAPLPVPSPPSSKTSKVDPIDASTNSQLNCSAEEEKRVSNCEDNALVTVFCCPYCSYISQNVEQTRSHVSSQHAVQPTFRCPLCQEQLLGKVSLHFHLTHVHNVVSECVEKLLLVATVVDMSLPTKLVPQCDMEKERTRCDPETGSQITDQNLEQPVGESSYKQEVSPAPVVSETCENGESFSEQQDQSKMDSADDCKDTEYQCEPPTTTGSGGAPKEQQPCEMSINGQICCLCHQKVDSLLELQEHLESTHTDLRKTDIQQLCERAAYKADGEKNMTASQEQQQDIEVGEDRHLQTEQDSSNGSALELRHPLSYRKSTNFALDKFLDPSRPYKCTVCKESFTQKNILLVHYNSVSHLHKMKKAAMDPSLPSRTEAVSSADKPFKCTICRVSYNQSSTLEIHMRSVLHQTRSRVAKLEAASQPGKASIPTVPAVHMEKSEPSGKSSCPTQIMPAKTEPVAVTQEPADSKTEPTSNKSMQSCKGTPTLESHDFSKKILEGPCLQVPGVPGLSFASSPIHLPLDLQRQASLLQAPIFAPPLLPPFPLMPDALLQFQQQQQQQLLLPFYVPEFKMNTDPGRPPALSMLSVPGAPVATVAEKQVEEQNQCLPPTSPKKTAASSEEPESCDSSVPAQPCESEKSKEPPEADEKQVKVEGPEACVLQNDELTKQEKEQKGSSMLPPRAPTDVSRTAARALLENFGFELVIQYNEGKQSLQRREEGKFPTSSGKMHCRVCGKLFSNMLILKSHEEHVHKRVLPFEQLSKYAKQFRKSYDSMCSFKQPISESPVMSGVPLQAAASNLPFQMTSPEPSQAISGAMKVPQLPLPVEFSLCPPFLMQPVPLQSLPPVLAPQLPVAEQALLPPVQAPGSEHSTEMNENKSSRTRITQEQLKILWSHFDINSFPTEEKILQVSELSGLPVKVVKHWFRNRLFKERQQDKDNPYNFSIPPALSLDDTTSDCQTLSTEYSKLDRTSNKRFSRTKFSDFQFQALQSFFEHCAYPKDDEVEHLSSLLKLPTRVIVVWFQNARQKARKNLEGQFNAESNREHMRLAADRCVVTGNTDYSCRKCSMTFQHIFSLLRHYKKCYSQSNGEDHLDECHQEFVTAPSEGTEKAPSVSIPADEFKHSLSTAGEILDQNDNLVEMESGNVSDLDVSCSVLREEKDSVETEEKDSVDKVTEEQEKQETVANVSNESDCIDRIDKSQDDVKDVTNVEKRDVTGGENQEKDETQMEVLPDNQQNSVMDLKEDRSSPKPNTEEEKINTQTSAPEALLVHKQTPTSPIVCQVTPSVKDESLLPEEKSYSCEQCKAVLPSLDLFTKHCAFHIIAGQNQLASAKLLDLPFMFFDNMNPLLPSSILPASVTQASSISEPISPRNPLKRKYEEDGVPHLDSDAGNMGEETPRDKRLRTTILPEQLEILYHWYMQDSNPTRKMLDCISEEVGLKKRVVQVWFQNTRARERKGQFRCVGPLQPIKQLNKFSLLGKMDPLDHKEPRFGDSMPFLQNMSSITLPEKFEYELTTQNFYSLNEETQFDKETLVVAPTLTCSDAVKSEDFSKAIPCKPSVAEEIGEASCETTTQADTATNYTISKSTGCDTNAVDDPTAKMEMDSDYPEDDFGSLSDHIQKTSPIPLKADNFKLSPFVPNLNLSFSPKESGTKSPGDVSETSSIADPESPSPCGNNNLSRFSESCDQPSQRRYRTQMTSLQLKVMKACYEIYRTPTMQECELLGSEIGLQKRVIQVWFQNARAKEKKAKMQGLSKSLGGEHSDGSGAAKSECTFCNVKYDFYVSCRSHIFSQQHITRLKEVIQNQLKNEIKFYDLAPTKPVPIQPRLEEVKLPSTPAAINKLTPQVLNSAPSFTALGFQNTNPALPGLAPVLLSGQTLAPPLGGLTPLNTGVTSPHLIGLAGSVSPAVIPVQNMPRNSLPQKTPHDQIPATASGIPVESKRETLQENEKKSGNVTLEDIKDSSESKSVPPVPVLPATDSISNSLKLKALQTAIAAGAAPMLGSQFLPFSLPGTTPLFSSQLSSGLPGAYLQQLYGLKKGLLPVNPVIPQTLMGLLPNSLLQQGLQEVLQKQLQSNLSLTISQATPPAREDTSKATPKDQDIVIPPENTSKEMETKVEDLPHAMISTVDVVHKFICMKCKMAFEDEDAISTHQKSFCYFDQPLKSQATSLCIPICTYHCSACDVLLSGKEALSSHLRSDSHKHRTLKQDSTFAKEQVSLPHADPNPNVTTTSQLMAS